MTERPDHDRGLRFGLAFSALCTFGCGASAYYFFTTGTDMWDGAALAVSVLGMSFWALIGLATAAAYWERRTGL